VDGEAIFLNVSSSTNSLIALNKTDGNLIWKAHKEKMTHASPVPATILGVRQIIYFNQSGLVAVTPETGKLLWKYPFSYSTSSGASPVVYEDMVYCSAAYGRGAAVVKISKVNDIFQVKELWRKSNTFMNHWSTPVVYKGFLFGLYGYGEYGSAPMKCIEMATGIEKWSIKGFGLGGLILVSDKLLVLSDFGDVVMVNPSSDSYQELGRWRAVNGKCWNGPAFSDGRLYVRSTKEGVCAQFTTPLPNRMQLLLPQKIANNRWRIGMKNADGSSFNPDRLGKIEILASSLFSIDTVQWDKADVSLNITNGVLYLEENLTQPVEKRFYMMRETP
jgi:outer membrane protein assembly factor BamB